VNLSLCSVRDVTVVRDSESALDVGAFATDSVKGFDDEETRLFDPW
jgi:hypothetical protein